MHPQIFGIVKSFGLLLAFSFTFGMWLSVRRGERRGFDRETVLDFCFTVLVSSLIGVRLFYVLTHPADFRPWWEAFMLWKGGLTLYGGILLAIVAVWWFCRRRGVDFLVMADVLAPQVALGIGVTRIGCYLNGCCYGHPTEGWWGVVFPSTCAAGYAYPGQHIHPTQLYASLGGFLVWGLLLLWERRGFRRGATFARFLLLYALSRFVVDGFRTYEVGAIGPLGLTISRWVSLALMAMGLWLLLRPGRGRS
jgi:phosphatidylglycerol:prolipoprotein diacylglycerol transferase